MFFTIIIYCNVILYPESALNVRTFCLRMIDFYTINTYNVLAFCVLWSMTKLVFFFGVKSFFSVHFSLATIKCTNPKVTTAWIEASILIYFHLKYSDKCQTKTFILRLPQSIFLSGIIPNYCRHHLRTSYLFMSYILFFFYIKYVSIIQSVQ